MITRKQVFRFCNRVRDKEWPNSAFSALGAYCNKLIIDRGHKTQKLSGAFGPKKSLYRPPGGKIAVSILIEQRYYHYSIEPVIENMYFIFEFLKFFKFSVTKSYCYFSST